MWHHRDILVVIVVNGVALLRQNGLSVRLSIGFDHVQARVLRVLSEVFLDPRCLANVTEGELLEVVLQAKLIVGLGLLCLQLVDDPEVAISGED